jgi:predicted RNA-binding protein with PUA-like domain
MNYWLLKSEPDVYSYADLVRDGSTIWDGVANNAALIFIRQVQIGDLALIYHTGDERRAIGIAEITSTAYPDPKLNDAKLVVFDIRPVKALGNPVALADVKADPFFADFRLVREPRLSVMPVNQQQWERLITMAKE